jgi:hypothetical protein
VNQQESFQSPSDNLAAAERAVLRQVRRRRLGGLIGGAAAFVMALAATGCPEPADLEGEHGGGTSVAGSAGSGGGSGTDPGAACEVECVKKIFTVTATTCKICHYANMPNATPPMPSLGQLDLVSPGVTSRLKDMPAKHVDITAPAGVTPMCPTGDKLIDSEFPGDSWMLKKIRGEQGTCGDKMPQSPPLSPTDLACLETYISCVAGNKPLTMTRGGGAAGSGSGGSAGSGTAGSGGSGGGSAGTGGMSGGTGGNGGSGGI